MIRAYVADGYTEPLAFHLCAALFAGRVLQRRGICGRDFSAGPYPFADGTVRFALLLWPHGREQVVGDAYDVATSFVAQLDEETRDDLLRDLTGEAPTERILPAAVEHAS